MSRVAVVGHIEWVDFIPVERFPRRGEVLQAEGSFARAAGGGGVAAAALRELAGEVDFFCALGRDREGEAAVGQLQERGVEVHVAWREPPTRRAFTLLEPGGERTIVTMGERLAPSGEDRLPWERLEGAAGVYFTAGDASALQRARVAEVVVATPRAQAALASKAPEVEALVYSAGDEDEAQAVQAATRRPRWLVETHGQRGGSWRGESEGSWDAVAPKQEPRDAYGCGDSFAAGFTLGLAEGRSVAEAAHVGAELSARFLCRSGAP